MKHFISIVLSITLLVLFPFSLLAQEKEATLEEIVVTATRDLQEIRKIPANVTVISKDEIERSNAKPLWTFYGVKLDLSSVTGPETEKPSMWTYVDLVKQDHSTHWS